MNQLYFNDLQAEVALLCARSLDEVERLRPIWQQMQRHPNTDIDFYLTILKSRKEIERPHVMLVVRHGTPRLLVVGRIERRPLSLPIGYKVINGPMARCLLILYEGVLGEGTEEDHGLILRHIQDMFNAGEFDMVEFNHLDIHSPMYTLATSLPPLICRANTPLANPHLRLSLNVSYKEYQHGLSRNTRKNLKRYGNRLVEVWGDKLQVRCYRSPQDLEIIMRDAETIASKTYQRGLGVGFHASEEMHRRMSLELDRGWLHAYFLYLDGKPVVFSFINIYKNIAYANETGFDPEYATYRAGHYLNERIIAELCEDPNITAMDFGFGDAEYKRAICDQVWEERPVYIFAPTWRGINLHTLFTLCGFLCRAGRKTAERFYLLPLIKRLWRRSIMPVRATQLLLLIFGLEDYARIYIS